MSNHPQVIIVGGGHAGCSSVYHLCNLGVRCLLLEAGEIGLGDTSEYTLSAKDQSVLQKDEEKTYRPYVSGTAVPSSPATLKMIVTGFVPSGVTADFVRHHGEEGAYQFFDLSTKGCDLQKTLARRHLPHADKQLVAKGSVFVCKRDEIEDLRKEYVFLKEIRKLDVEWLREEEVIGMHGSSSHFVGGIFFPHDAVIDSPSYCRSLIDHSLKTGFLTVRKKCPRVTDVSTVTNHDHVGSERTGARAGRVTLEDGTQMFADHVVVATGGRFHNRDLAGLLRPCWSYLTCIPATPKTTTSTTEADVGSGDGDGDGDGGDGGDGEEDTSRVILEGSGMMESPYSPNFISWGSEAMDWCVSDAQVRISGEDHFSAMKPPQTEKRCQNMMDWLHDRYPYLPPKEEVNTTFHSGVYSETPDDLPLVGKFQHDSRICYVVGCNAWGQATLSYSAALVPGILGYTQMTDDEVVKATFLSPARFTHVALAKL
eukprot:TRINITY_DN196_c0_g1_i2.p1 TRINITY_DN196_c0_g1~~TRINITY_DN196_c0_g1_i2.p1  ORF type:complete len:483 (-),score=101.76 TRINITY_DN196_c0_g1_i2:311-1759(-)